MANQLEKDLHHTLKMLSAEECKKLSGGKILIGQCRFYRLLPYAFSLPIPQRIELEKSRVS